MLTIRHAAPAVETQPREPMPEGRRDGTHAVTIVLADDHELVRRGVRSLLQPAREFAVVAEARDGVEAVQLAERWSPDILVADIEMPGLDGIEVTRRVAQRHPATKTVILSMHDDEARVIEALRAGAMAYVLKQAVAADLVVAVRAVLTGHRFLSPPLSQRAMDDYAVRLAGRPSAPYDMLTIREREVLGLIAKGLTYAEVAQRLHISTHTVNVHMTHLMRKLGVHTSKEIIRYVLERGLPA